jgi:hypothetical protein
MLRQAPDELLDAQRLRDPIKESAILLINALV